MKTLSIYIGGTAAAVLVSVLLAWFIFTASPGTANPNSTTTYGSTNSNATTATFGGATLGGGSSSQGGGSPAGQVVTQTKVFKLSDGPIAGATLVQTTLPTTTIARYVMADNGHAYDLPLDVPGAAPKPLSNTTIPGALSTAWAGGSVLLQYLDGNTPKTVYLGLPMPNATSSATRLAFLPDGIVGLATSPDGKLVAYLLRTAQGTDGYVANPDGTSLKKLFSLPLSQVQLRWPAQGTLLAYSNAASGVPGMAFNIDAKSGAVTPLFSALGLTAIADRAFRHVLYQTDSGSGRASFDHDVASGGESELSFTPNPEQCVQSPLNVSVLLCAVPLSYVAPGFLDLWHQGKASAPDSLIVYDLSNGKSGLIATPGSASDGGIATDMLQIAVSPDGKYALFVSKYDRSLWAVRLF